MGLLGWDGGKKTIREDQSDSTDLRWCQRSSVMLRQVNSLAWRLLQEIEHQAFPENHPVSLQKWCSVIGKSSVKRFQIFKNKGRGKLMFWQNINLIFLSIQDFPYSNHSMHVLPQENDLNFDSSDLQWDKFVLHTLWFSRTICYFSSYLPINVQPVRIIHKSTSILGNNSTDGTDSGTKSTVISAIMPCPNFYRKYATPFFMAVFSNS